ncbi:hypothetical protein FGE12_06580 [Aggregicoccus sp. 17bor-14]|uniref:hypothetical protein n=1 Tax=Myxococcaceae TaxID=31 RepID=UPI00129C8A88|nr:MULTISPECIES: hypothetical protein [Myxococcaceae]MBF5042054.1 hypothetical protein [Simulacricoccus sp. 17bor-14]MRI87832.1 hypothetical protein [Aggregicoccus sp. 17bor-14]
MKRLALVAFVALALLGLWLVRRRSEHAAVPASAPAATSSTSTSTSTSARPGVAPLLASAALPPEQQQAFIATLRARYGARLSSPLIQLKLIEALVREFRGRGPDWKAELLRTLQAAFPDSYALLSARLEQWLGYEAWMQANAGDLQALDAEDRRANLWAQREALFGKADAEEIWAFELRSERVAKALAQIDAAPDARLPDRLQRYRESLKEAYGDAAPAFLERHRQEALDRFLDLGSVQRELSALPAAERSAQLRDIRSGLGMDAQALGRWEQLDGTRDARWSVGERYMAERAALLRDYQGEEQARRLAQLRERLFGQEAQTLASEEASGFLRFEQPRRWGRN